MSLKILGSLAALLLSGAVAVHAGEPVAASPAPPPAKVDESALRYYASHNELDYYQAEVKRLRALYPDWTPPGNPADLAGEDDPEATLWPLFAKDDLSGLDRAIAALEAARPGWTPSADLAAKIDAKKARRDLIAASDAGNTAEVLRLAGSRPALAGGCTDPEAAWRVAAAKAASGDKAAALADYRLLATTCPRPSARHASIEKALAALGPEAARPLLFVGQSDASGTPEFADLADAFTRAGIAAKLGDPAAADPDGKDVAAFATHALAASAPDAAMLGWFYRQKQDHAAALDAFEQASTLLGQDGDPQARSKVVEGIVLSLADVGRRAEAVDLARGNWKLSDDLAKAYVEIGAERFEGAPRPRLPDAEIADYAAATLARRSPVGAEAIGWYAYDFKQWNGAARWFDTALSWGKSEGAAHGALLAAAARKDRAGAQAILAKWEPDFPSLGEDFRTLAEAPAAPRKAAKRPKSNTGDALSVRFQRKDYSGCVALARTLPALNAGQKQMLGWCLLKLGRPAEAAQSFGEAASGSATAGNRQDAVYGRSLALFAAGDARGAAALAGSEPMTAKRRGEIGIAVLADQAIAAFGRSDWRQVLAVLDERRRHAPETLDLSAMRGWALFHLGDRAGAKALFVALDQTLSTPETRKALAAVAQSSQAR